MPNIEAITIYKNYLNMVKFVTTNNKGYKKLLGHIFLMLENIGA